MLDRFVDAPLFGLMLSLVAYVFGLWVNRILRSSLANPLLIAMTLIAVLLKAGGIDYMRYYESSRILPLLLGPATAALAISIYRRRDVLQRAWLPILAGCTAGSVVSLVSVYIGAMLLGLDKMVTASLLPKSVTAAIAVGLAEGHGGLAALATLATCITGITGAVFFPGLVRLFHIKDDVALGVALGATCHVVGTSKAAELGELQGAMAGIAIGVTGVVTTILFVFTSHIPL